MQATKTLADAGVEFNILTVVNRVNQDRGAQTYRWLRDQGFAYLQFIPAVETDEKGAPLPFAATPEGYGRFLCEVFDAWRKEGGPGKVYVRFFESVICHLAGAPAGSCLFGNRCDHYLVVEHTGDVHPCDFFVRSDLRIGNILEADFPDLTDRTVRKTFARAKGKLPEPCKTCRFLTLCRGGCLKDRERACGNFSCPSYLCPSYKLFYSHSLDWFRQTVRRLQSPRPAKPSRNQPCPCGSDRKYKHCCGK